MAQRKRGRRLRKCIERAEQVADGLAVERKRHVAALLELEAMLRGDPLPPPPPPPAVEFDIHTAVIASNSAQRIAGWPATSTITRVRVVEEYPDDQGRGQRVSKICIDHSMLRKWPAVMDSAHGAVPIEGNCWIFAFLDPDTGLYDPDGELHGGTYEHNRPGQECKELDLRGEGGTIATRIGPHVKQGPLKSYVPKAGDLVGVMVSTPARNGDEKLDVNVTDERSNIEPFVWPDDV